MATKKAEAKKSEPQAEPEAKVVPPSTVDKLLAMKDEVHVAAATADSDITRTHLNNIEKAISTLGDGLEQIKRLDRTWVREV